MSRYAPELGQVVFGGPWAEYEMQPHVEWGLEVIAGAIGGKYSPISNTGASFKNDTFTMEAYCWCDGDDGSRHPGGCPPNFKYGDFEARWYKWLGRGSSQNRLLTQEEWDDIQRACVASL